MAEVSAVKIPFYNNADPALWFHMCEATFELAVPKPITESRTKFNYVVSHLPPDTASIVRDIIFKPNTEDPYSHLKNELIKRAGESSHAEIRRLLAGEQLGDRKPSELLRGMQRRATSHSVPTDIILELFMQQLPANVQQILAAITPLTLDKAAEIADRILEVNPIPMSVSAVGNNVSEIEDLKRQIAKLTLQIEKLSRSRSRSRSRRRDSSQSRSVCFYHKKFGDNARNCTPWCSFKKTRLSKNRGDILFETHLSSPVYER